MEAFFLLHRALHKALREAHVLIVETVEVGLEAGAGVRVKIVEHLVALFLLPEPQVTRLRELRTVLVATGQRLHLVTVDERLLLANVLLVDRRKVLVGAEPPLAHRVLEAGELVPAGLGVDGIVVLHCNLVDDLVPNAVCLGTVRVQKDAAVWRHALAGFVVGLHLLTLVVGAGGAGLARLLLLHIGVFSAFVEVVGEVEFVRKLRRLRAQDLENVGRLLRLRMQYLIRGLENAIDNAALVHKFCFHGDYVLLES